MYLTVSMLQTNCVALKSNTSDLTRFQSVISWCNSFLASEHLKLQVATKVHKRNISDKMFYIERTKKM